MIQFAANQERLIPNTSFNDLYLNANNDIATVSDVDCIEQSVTAAIWMCLNDSDFNNTIGIPWINLLSTEPLNVSLLHYHLRKAVLRVNDYIPASEVNLYTIQSDMKISLVSNTETGILSININYTLANGKRLSVNVDTSDFN